MKTCCLIAKLVRSPALAVLLVTASLLAACGPTQTGTLDYSTVFDGSIPVGKKLVGTDIQYLGKTEQGAQLSIGGETGLKKVFDSLTWKGEAAPGVDIDYNLRIISFDTQALQAAGTANLSIRGAKPKAIAASALPPNLPTFKAVVSYDVPKGQAIPGTTITYDGKTADGAKLGGVEGAPYRKAADSIDWIGQLGDRVYLSLSHRVLFFDDNSLKTTGGATIYIKP